MWDIILTGLDYIFHFIGSVAFIWVPILLFVIAKKLWHHYVEEDFITGIKWSVLEIRIPRTVDKSPQAMELILTNALYQVTNKGLMETYWQGAVRFWASLEMVSIEGRVHFYICVPSRLKQVVETQVYAQYSQAEVIEVEDYAMKIPHLEKDGPWGMWGCEFGLSKPDPLPIKTYIDYGMDKAVGSEEEEKIDPLTPTIEYLGSLGKGEQVWIQILIRGTEKHYHTHGTMFGHHHFEEEAEHYLDTILAPYVSYRINDEIGGIGIDARTPDRLKDTVKAVLQKKQKLSFDTGIRCVYVAKKENYNKNTYRALRTMFRQYSNGTLNSFQRRHNTSYDYPWADPNGSILIHIKNRMLDQYRLRMYFYPQLRYSFNYPWPISFFYPSHKPEPFILNTEELATIFHFPGMVSRTPAFKRIESRKSQPPTNLPI